MANCIIKLFFQSFPLYCQSKKIQRLVNVFCYNPFDLIENNFVFITTVFELFLFELVFFTSVFAFERFVQWD